MSKQQGRYEIDFSNNYEFFWRFMKNGREIARQSETHKRKAAVKRSIEIMRGSNAAEVIDFTRKK